MNRISFVQTQSLNNSHVVYLGNLFTSRKTNTNRQPFDAVLNFELIISRTSAISQFQLLHFLL